MSVVSTILSTMIAQESAGVLGVPYSGKPSAAELEAVSCIPKFNDSMSRIRQGYLDKLRKLRELEKVQAEKEQLRQAREESSRKRQRRELEEAEAAAARASAQAVSTQTSSDCNTTPAVASDSSAGGGSPPAAQRRRIGVIAR
jgi:hypothetical protein